MEHCLQKKISSLFHFIIFIIVNEKIKKMIITEICYSDSVQLSKSTMFIEG